MKHTEDLITRLRDKSDIIPDMTVRQANAHLICLCEEAADELETLMNAVAAEREACAQVAELAEPYQAADLIRARGQA